MAAFKARKPGTCAMCNGAVNVGDYISWSRKPRAGLQPRATYHARCAGTPDPVEPPAGLEPINAPSNLPSEPRLCYVPACFQEAVHGFKGCNDHEEPGLCRKDGCMVAALPGTRHCTTHSATNAQGTPEPAATDPVVPALPPSGNAALDALAEALAPRIGALVTAEVKDLDAKIAAAVEAARIPQSLTIIVKRPEPHPPITIKHAHPMLVMLVRLFQAGKNAYVHGPAGTGKSTGIAQAFEMLGLDHSLMCLNPGVGSLDVFGYRSPSGEYQSTVFHDRFANGGGICFDELDNSAAELQARLNGALANGRTSFPYGNVPKHPTFLCGGTGNTIGLGGGQRYQGRRPMDGAFRSRFAFLYWGYDEAFERTVALERYSKADAWVTWVFNTRNYCASNYPALEVTPRASFEGADLLSQGFTPADAAEMYVFQGMDRDSVSRILNACPLPTVARA